MACGTSWHAALTGKYLIEEHCRIPVDVEIASEFRYCNPLVSEKTLGLDDQIEEIACEYLTSWDAIYLGRGISYPIALEGALKLKEISYIYAAGYPAGEMKHGPIALIDREMPVFILAPNDRHLVKVLSNMEEVLTRGGRVVILCSEGDYEAGKRAEFTLQIPWGGESLSPVLFSVAMQLVAYNFSILKGKDVDQPRNLAKSVTVE